VQWLIYDQTPVVDLEEEDRLQLGNFGVALERPEDGFIQGNQLQVSAVVTTTLYRSWPDSLLPYPAYIWQFGPTFQKKSNFEYQFATTENDLHDNMETGVIDDWQEDGEGRFFITRNPVSGYIFPFNQTGINRAVTAYLAEGHAIKAQECIGIPNPLLIPPIVPVCYLRNDKDTLQINLSEGLKFDVLPATLDGFHELTPDCTSGCALAWGAFPIQKDADGDGLRSATAGGNDPNDRAPDADLDGLSDFYELKFGSNPLHADGDNDGLTDYEEMRYETDPNRADSDNDGLLDGEEVTGWEFVYGFDSASQPLITHVTADPLSPDTDGDGVTDKLEQVYGFNPRVVGPANVLNISSEFDDADGFVAPGQTVAYTATIKNELRDRYALGLLEVSSPQNGLTGTPPPQVYTLNPREEASVAGSLTVANLSQSQPISVTNTAGAIIANLRAEADGRQLWLHLDEDSGATIFKDDSLLGHDAACQGNGCPAAGGEGVYGRALHFDGYDDRITSFFDPSEDAYSLALWFKTTCTHCGLAWTATSGRSLYLNSGGYLCANTGSELCAVTGPYNDGQWHHVVHTIRRAGNEQKLYVDGILAGTGPFSLGQLAYRESVIFGVASGYASFAGWMDELELYPRVLTQEEITARFQQPVFHATFDEPAGDFMDSAFGLRLTCPAGRCPSRIGGMRGGAVSFNQKQHLETSGPQVDLSRGNGFTLAAWVYPIPTFDSRWHALLGNTAGAPSMWYYGPYSLRVEFGPAGQKCSYQGAILSPNRWQHVVAAFDGSTLQIYMNGQWQDTTACNGKTPYSTTTLHIGRASQQGWIKFTDVYVDDEGDGLGTAEYQLTLDDNEIWYQEDIDEKHYYQINQTHLVADDNNHNFKLWEIDPKNNDLNISQNFNNTTIGHFQTDYNTDGKGTLNWNSWNEFYNGRLDDLRLYSYPLTAVEVADLYQSSSRALEMRFDDPPGADAFQDHSGNGVTGVCAPPACPDTGLPGRDNQAVRFDGVNDYIAADSLTSSLAGEAISFGGWVYPDPAQNGWGSLLAFHTSGGSNRNLLFYDCGSSRFFYYDDSNGAVYSTHTFTPGQWYHVMVVID
ncbi:MAG: LamG-like jellyroll fold domain-containing protein, partial [Anaerolineae bacterium]